MLENGVGQDTFAWTALTVPRPGSWPVDVTDQKLTAEQIKNAPVVKAARRLEANLEAAGMAHVQLLDMNALKSFAHLTWNLAPQRWFELIEHPDDTAWDGRTGPYYPWPTTELVVPLAPDGKLFLDTGGTKPRLWEVVRREDKMVYADAFAPMFDTTEIEDTSRTGLIIATTGELFISRKASKRMDRSINFGDTVNEILHGDREGRHISTRELLESDESAGLQHLLDIGGRIGFYYNTFAITSGLDFEALAHADAVLLSHAKDSQITIEPVKSRSRYVRVFNSSAFGVNMV